MLQSLGWTTSRTRIAVWQKDEMNLAVAKDVIAKAISAEIEKHGTQ
jgi:hypothetical protein